MATTDQRYPENYFAMITEFGETLINQGDEQDGQSVLDAVDAYAEVDDKTARSLSADIYQLGHTDQMKQYKGGDL